MAGTGAHVLLGLAPRCAPHAADRRGRRRAPPRQADHHPQPVLVRKVEQPAWRRRVRADGVHPSGCHRGEVAADGRGIGIRGAVRPVTERPVGDSADVLFFAADLDEARCHSGSAYGVTYVRTLADRHRRLHAACSEWLVSFLPCLTRSSQCLSRQCTNDPPHEVARPLTLIEHRPSWKRSQPMSSVLAGAGADAVSSALTRLLIGNLAARLKNRRRSPPPRTAAPPAFRNRGYQVNRSTLSPFSVD